MAGLAQYQFSWFGLGQKGKQLAHLRSQTGKLQVVLFRLKRLCLGPVLLAGLSLLLVACGSLFNDSYSEADIVGDWVQHIRYGTNDPGILCTQFHFNSDGTYTSQNMPTWQLFSTPKHEVISANGTWELGSPGMSPRIYLYVRNAETGKDMYGGGMLEILRDTIMSRPFSLVGGGVDDSGLDRLTLTRDKREGCK